MGWTSFNLREPIKQWFKNDWESNGKYKVLDSALVKRTTMYGAIKNLNTNEVFCAVFLIRWSNSDYNFSYKDMTEFEGPYQYECPQRIFNLLTPLSEIKTISEFAKNWREKVIAYHKTRESLKGTCVIKLKTPIDFNTKPVKMSFDHFLKIGRKYFAGTFQVNGIFATFCRVTFNPLKYEHEVIKYSL
jgi:hypothetical protein